MVMNIQEIIQVVEPLIYQYSLYNFLNKQAWYE